MFAVAAPRPRTLGLAFVRVVAVPIVLASLVVGSVMVLSETSPKSLSFAFHAQLIDESPSPTLAPGATTAYTVHFRNLGLMPWQRGTSRQVNLGVIGDSAKFAEAGIALGWLAPDRPATTSEGLVLPGMIGTFTFSVRAPTTPGVYRIPLLLVVDGVTWLEDSRVNLVLTSDLGFHSQLVDQSAHPTLKPGQLSAPITVRFRNTGAKTWTLGAAGQQANLGIAGDDRSKSALGFGWPSADRVATQNEATVRPGGVATFTFQVRAPTTPGSYALPLRLVVDGLTWMDDESVVIVTVVGATGATAPAQVAQPPLFTIGASADTQSVAVGGMVLITATFTSETASTAVVGVEINAPGGETLAYQKWFQDETFAAGQQRAYQIPWLVPLGTATGTYTVTAGAFSSGWKTKYGTKPAVASFSVTSPAAVSAPITAPTVVSTPVPAPTAAASSPSATSPSTTLTPAPTAVPTATAAVSSPAATSPQATTTPAPTSTPTSTPAPTATPLPAPSFTSTAMLSGPSVIAGGSVGITASVTSATATTAVVDIEIYAPGAASAIYQVYFENQTFAAGQQRSYPATWLVPAGTAVGNYSVKLGVFAPNWASLYSWNDSAAIFSVVPQATPSPTLSGTPSPFPSATATVVPTSAPTPTVAPTPPPAPGAFTLIPANRLTTWNPGIPGGVPARTTVCANVSAATYGNGSVDATAGMQAALDACPIGQVVQLGAGDFKITSTLHITKGIVLRGMGPTQTRLKMPVGTNANLVTIGLQWFKFTQSTNLASDAVKDAQSVTLSSNPGLTVGEIVEVDQLTDSSVTEWSSKSPPGDASRGWFNRPNRPVGQTMEVAAVSGNTVTFTTPFHIGFQTAFAAQLSRFSDSDNGAVVPVVKYGGVEDLYLYGGSQGQGNIWLSNAAYSWIKNIESDFQDGPSVAINASFRTIVRDSYIHSTQNPNPGGAGYGISFSTYSADNLVENNIVWNMNKVMVMRASGGGNVIGYNYMEDGWISYNTGWVETGLNGSHMTTPHYELFEGNQSFNFDGDNTWGNSVYITVFRNQFTGQRRSIAPLTLTDTQNRRAAGLMEGHWWYSFVGNVLGTAGMSSAIAIWELGYNPENWNAPADPKVLSTVIREGNYDYATNQVHWSGAAQQLPDSLYLRSKPAFFGTSAWPWVDPSGSTKVFALPARARFDAMPSH